MSEDIQFDTDKETFNPNRLNTNNSKPRPSNMTSWLVKHGIKSESSAQHILLSIVILFFILTFIIYYSFLYTPSTTKNKNSISPAKERFNNSQNTLHNF